MAETQILGWGTQSAPAQRVTKDTEVFTLLALDATFDGTGAGGNFVPALQVVSDAGAEVGTFPLASTISAGSSTKVTFAPFLRSTSSGGSDPTDELHWGTNTDSLSEGLTLNAQGAVAVNGGAHTIGVDTGGAANLTLYANIGNFSLGNFWNTISCNGSTSIDVVPIGQLNLGSTTGATAITGLHDSSWTLSGAAGTGGKLTLNCDGGVAISGGNTGVVIDAASHGISSPAANVVVNTQNGQTFTVNDHSGNPILVLTG
jgi:hypothetical protein